MKLKIALYRELPADATAYTPEGEVEGPGYQAGGIDLVLDEPKSIFEGALHFQDAVWTGASFAATGSMIYLDDENKRALDVRSFCQAREVAGGQFIVSGLNTAPPGPEYELEALLQEKT